MRVCVRVYVRAQLSTGTKKPQTMWNLSKLHIENLAGQRHCSHANNNACGRKSIPATDERGGLDCGLS